MIKNFNDVIKKFIKKKDPIVFDIGGNRGQSIKLFRKLYPKCIIHSFEPVKSEFKYLEENFNSKKNYLNNYGVGNCNKKLPFYTTKGTANSSFLKITPGTKWLKNRSKYWNTTPKNFIVKKNKIKVVTLDNYTNKKKVNKIDILKIDTEGFSEKVLQGCKKLLKKNTISLILVEVKMDNTYEKDESFYGIEKLLHKNFKLYAIETLDKFVTRLHDSFGCDVVYVNNKLIKNK